MRADNYALLSYAQCGKRLGISPARVRQIEQRALQKLRVAFHKIGVKTSLRPDELPCNSG